VSEGEFYVGWQERAPQAHAARMRKLVCGLLFLAAGVSCWLTTGFETLPAASFEFGRPRSFVGVLGDDPVPCLRVERPGEMGELSISSEYPLVAFGKHGAGPAIADQVGERVRLEGTLIYRDGRTMIELKDGSIEPAGEMEPLSEAASESMGTFTLRGTIVDSKCFFGVMNPGFSKAHRACAARCIAGGIPPVFWVRDGAGEACYLLLLSPGGEPVNARVLEFVAEPLESRGEVVRYGDLLALLADPGEYRRLE